MKSRAIIITNHKQIKHFLPPNIHILFVSIAYYSKFFLILIGKPPPYQKQNCQHTERRVVFKKRSFKFKIMEFGIKISMDF